MTSRQINKHKETIIMTLIVDDLNSTFLEMLSSLNKFKLIILIVPSPPEVHYQRFYMIHDIKCMYVCLYVYTIIL